MERDRLLNDIYELIKNLRLLGVETIFDDADELHKLDKWFIKELKMGVGSFYISSFSAYLGGNGIADVYIDIDGEDGSSIKLSSIIENEKVCVRENGLQTIYKFLTYEHLQGLKEFLMNRYEKECEKQDSVYNDD